MEFKIQVSNRTQIEIESIMDFYNSRSIKISALFLKSLENSYLSLTKNPYHKILYKNVRTLKIYKFPFNLFYVINEENKSIKILSCFHNKRNPIKRP